MLSKRVPVALTGASIELASVGYPNMALALARASVRMAIERLGEQHPDTILAMTNLGTSLRLREQLDESREWGRRAISTSERVLGPDHEFTILCVHNHASRLLGSEKWDEAEPHVMRAMKYRQRNPSTQKSEMARYILVSLGELRRGQGRWEEAKEIYEKCFHEWLEQVGMDDPTAMTIVIHLTRAQVHLRDYETAHRLLVENENRARKAFGQLQKASLATYLARDGLCRLQLNDFAGAEAVLTEAVEALRGQRGVETTMAECARVFAELFAAWDAAEPGKGYDQRAAEWKAKREAME